MNAATIRELRDAESISELLDAWDAALADLPVDSVLSIEVKFDRVTTYTYVFLKARHDRWYTTARGGLVRSTPGLANWLTDNKVPVENAFIASSWESLA